MIKRYLPFFVAIILLLLVTGCFGSNSSDKNDTNENEDIKQEDREENEKNEDESIEVGQQQVEEEDEIVVDPLPSTFEELEQLPAGPDAGWVYEPEKRTMEESKQLVLETFSDLPDISNNPSQEQLDYFYRELLKRVQRDFQGPEHIKREIRFSALGDPDIGDSRYEFKEQLNVIVLLDASGSMANLVDGEKTRMDAAKDAITWFMRDLPEETNVALRVYGHEGSGSQSDKDRSCSSSELVYGFAPYAESDFSAALNQFQPAGWTPTGLALSEAEKDLSSFDGETNTNIVYLVSDGIETCETNPLEAAEQLYNSDILPIINVIGFGVLGNEQNHLREIADRVDGIYQTVNDENELLEEFNKTKQISEAWEEWKKQGMISLRKRNFEIETLIYRYITNQRVNRGNQREQIYLLLSVFRDHDLFDRDSFQYLDNLNKEFHDWIGGEIERFREELYELSDATYEEAIKKLEERYESNVDEN
ncbi:MAG TPA: VWA domain-containing protein [Atopostipes sp.]|nr:VWA domain-containing protein [Atopostipes sp.]